jgi:hypothetical protein
MQLEYMWSIGSGYYVDSYAGLPLCESYDFVVTVQDYSLSASIAWLHIYC